jgi:hypothetical protein
MPKVTTASTIPSFNKNASTIIAGYRKFDKASASFSQTLVMSFQQYIDACAIAGVSRDRAGVTAIGKGMRDCQIIVDAQAVGYVDKTFTEYVQSAMRAYFHNVPFAPSLKNDPAMKIPGKDGSVKSAGSVKTTSNEALYKTLRKALEQARILGLDEQAAGLLDFCLDTFTGFSETESATV